MSERICNGTSNDNSYLSCVNMCFSFLFFSFLLLLYVMSYQEVLIIILENLLCITLVACYYVLLCVMPHLFWCVICYYVFWTIPCSRLFVIMCYHHATRYVFLSRELPGHKFDIFRNQTSALCYRISGQLQLSQAHWLLEHHNS